MKFINTLEAAKSQEIRTWAVADGLVLDYAEAGVVPTMAHFKEATDTLAARGIDYDPMTIRDYWRTAVTFTPSSRRKTATVKLYSEIIRPLWARVNPETRHNELVSYAAQFFASVKPATGRTLPGAYKARAWAKSQANALDAERKAADKPAAGTDTKATSKEEKQEADEKRLQLEARTEIEAALANIGVRIAFLANTYIRYQEHLTDEDRYAYAEEIELEEGRLALIRSEFSGTASDKALAAALAEWESA
jgi:hypothetical protein